METNNTYWEVIKLQQKIEYDKLTRVTCGYSFLYYFTEMENQNNDVIS